MGKIKLKDMKRMIKLKESQLKYAMGKSFEYIQESEYSEVDCQLNPSVSNGVPQVGVAPVITNDTNGTEVGRPITTDEFASSQVQHTPIRNAYSPARGLR